MLQVKTNGYVVVTLLLSSLADRAADGHSQPRLLDPP